MLTRVTPEQTAQATAVLERSFVSYMQPLGRTPGPYPWMKQAVVDGQVHWVADQRGILVSRMDGPVFLVEQIGIDPNHQGRGIGARAMAAVEALARSKDAQVIQLVTAQVHTHPVAFYSGLGYRVVDIRPGTSGKDTIPRIQMVKDLT